MPATAKKKAFPKAAGETIALLESIIPVAPGVDLKPMFGHKAAFVNGNMFAGTFGDAMVFRLAEKDRAALLDVPGAGIFEPIAGRPMKEYVRVDPKKLKSAKELSSWAARALAYARGLPPKVKAKPKATAKAVAKKKTAKR